MFLFLFSYSVCFYFTYFTSSKHISNIFFPLQYRQTFEKFFFTFYVSKTQNKICENTNGYMKLNNCLAFSVEHFALITVLHTLGILSTNLMSWSGMLFQSWTMVKEF